MKKILKRIGFVLIPVVVLGLIGIILEANGGYVTQAYNWLKDVLTIPSSSETSSAFRAIINR